MQFFNIINQVFQKKRVYILINKFFSRINLNKNHADLVWLSENSISWKIYLKNIDNDLFNETKTIIKRLSIENKQILEKINIKLGGSANQFLLYFFVRHLKPNIVFETGVAAGHSSKAILFAIKENNKGILYSSDFPYFRIKNPEKYIGLLVNESLKVNWKLEIEGDSINIPKFLKKVDCIDLFHYDSDKSYLAKKKIFKLIENKMSKNSVLIFDDIQDDIFFKEIVMKYKLKFKVFKFKNKFVGLVRN